MEEVNIADLWVSHLSEHQQYLYETIVKFRDQGCSYIKISQWLMITTLIPQEERILRYHKMFRSIF